MTTVLHRIPTIAIQTQAFLEISLTSLMRKLFKIIERHSYYLSEINVLHPSREGNGRAQRVFLEFLGKIAGYDIDFTDRTIC